MQQGIQQIDEKIYRSIKDWVSISELNLMRVAPEIYKYRILEENKDPPTKAQSDGIAVHTAVLEPFKFIKRYKKLPELDARTKKGKDLKASIQDENPDAKLLKADEYDRYMAICNKVREHQSARILLEDPGLEIEHSMFWVNEETGMQCKGRTDGYSHTNNFVLDLKTTKDAKNFSRSILDYGYHRQAAFYLDGLSTITGKEYKDFFWIAVETEAPYLCAVYKADENCLAIGRQEYTRDLKALKICRDKNFYPGLPQEVLKVSLPQWYVEKALQVNL